jgi:hypothetical protein
MYHGFSQPEYLFDQSTLVPGKYYMANFSLGIPDGFSNAGWSLDLFLRTIIPGPGFYFKATS